MMIASYSELSLSKARDMAKELSARVSLGYDVAGEKQERKADAIKKMEAEKNAKKFHQLAAEYFESQILGRWKHPDILRRRIDKDINPNIGSMKVEDVKPRHIDDMLKGIVKRGAPTIATDVLRWTRRIFDYGIKREYLEVNPCSAIYDALALGYFTPTDEQNMIIYRWIVATLFIHDQLVKNGTVEVTEEDGTKGEAVMYIGEHGGMSIYPAPERLALANNLEAIACEMYRENSCAAAVQMYQMFVEVKDGALCLSEWGLNGMTDLHDGFIQTLNEEGFPADTVKH